MWMILSGPRALLGLISCFTRRIAGGIGWYRDFLALALAFASDWSKWGKGHTPLIVYGEAFLARGLENSNK
jgi:hypothetical protein